MIKRGATEVQTFLHCHLQKSHTRNLQKEARANYEKVMYELLKTETQVFQLILKVELSDKPEIC